MASGERREREKAEVRVRILSAARDLFASRGIDAVTMRGIAEAIEYTPAALYVHFRDKDDLLRALCRNDFEALNAQQQRVAKVADPVERIRRIGLAVVRFAVEHPNHYRFMFMTPMKCLEPAPEDLARRGDPDVDGYAFFVGIVKEAIESGRMREGLRDAHLVAQTLWAGIHGVAALHITHADDPWLPMRPVGARAKTMVDALIAGLTVAAPARGTSGSSRKTRRRA
jgi:AcrR family transcriptional regulator